MKEVDGVYVNLNHISAVMPEFVTTTSDEYYVIKFLLGPELLRGKTHFRTEDECKNKIKELLD